MLRDQDFMFIDDTRYFRNTKSSEYKNFCVKWCFLNFKKLFLYLFTKNLQIKYKEIEYYFYKYL